MRRLFPAIFVLAILLLLTAACDAPALDFPAEPSTQAAPTAQPAAGTTPEIADATAEQAEAPSDIAVAPENRVESTSPATATLEVASCDVLWEELLVEHGENYAECSLDEVEEASACEPPEVVSATGVELHETVNIELILDSSGSMAGEVEGGIKMDVAKQTLADFANSLPEAFNVALRVYGHTGSNSEVDKPVSCRGTELLYEFAPLDSTQFASAVASFQPTGWTPIAGSLQAAQQDFAGFDPSVNTNFVYLVSDGIETCDGDPIAASQALHESDVQPIVNVIGFGVDAETQQQLEQVAAAGGGIYYGANGAEELRAIFETNVNFADYLTCANAEASRQIVGNSTAISNWYVCTAQKTVAEFSAMSAALAEGVAAQEPEYVACSGEIQTRLRTRKDAIELPAREAFKAGIDDAAQKYEEAQAAIDEVISNHPNNQ